MFPSPTCPFRSAPKNNLSSFDTLSINPSRSCQKSFFSSILLLICGAYALTIFRIDSFTPVSWPLFCLIPFLPARHFRPDSPSPLSLPHFFFHYLRRTIVCRQLQCSLLYSLSNLFPVGTVNLHSFAPTCLPALSPFQLLFQHLRYQSLRVSVFLSTLLAASSLALLRFFSTFFTMFCSCIIFTGALPCDT